MDENTDTHENALTPGTDKTASTLNADQITDLMQRFYLTGISLPVQDDRSQETDRSELQLGLLSYSDNLVDWYYQSILLQHFHYAMVLTEGLRGADTTLSDRAGQATDALRGISHPFVQAPVQLADKFITLLKQQETRTDIALALAYANLQVTRLEFSIVTRLVAKRVDFDYRENQQGRLQASAIAKALVRRLEVGLLMYSNPYAHMPAMAMKHDKLQMIFPDLSELSIGRIASVVPYLLFLMNDHSIAPSLVDRVTSRLSGLLDPVGYEAAQQLSNDSIMIKPAINGEPLALYLRAPVGEDQLPALSDYTWEMRDEDIDLTRLPSRLEAWNGARDVLAHSLKLSHSQIERVLAHWLTDHLVEAYTATRSLPSCFDLPKRKCETSYIEIFFKQTVFNYLLKPDGTRNTNDLIRHIMDTHSGKQSLNRRLDTMAAGFIKQLREMTRHYRLAPYSVIQDQSGMNILTEVDGNQLVRTCWDKSATLTHLNHTELKKLVDLSLKESLDKDIELSQTTDIRLINVAGPSLRSPAAKMRSKCKKSKPSPTHTSRGKMPEDPRIRSKSSKKLLHSSSAMSPSSSLMATTKSSRSKNPIFHSEHTQKTSHLTETRNLTSRSRRNNF